MMPVDRGIRALLAADSTLGALASNGVHKAAPPEGVGPPYLVFVSTDDTPEKTAGNPAAWVSSLYTVRGVGVATATKGPGDAAEAIRDRAVDVLTARGPGGSGWALGVTGYRVMYVSWQRNITPYSEVIGGVVRVHAPAYVLIQVVPL